MELAVNLAKRGNLPGAENLVLQRFQELFAQMKYKEAAELAADSPQGVLRTPDTVAKFQVCFCTPLLPSTSLPFFPGLLLQPVAAVASVASLYCRALRCSLWNEALACPLLACPGCMCSFQALELPHDFAIPA